MLLPCHAVVLSKFAFDCRIPTASLQPSETWNSQFLGKNLWKINALCHRAETGLKAHMLLWKQLSVRAPKPSLRNAYGYASRQ